jgi:hypothetical protein
MSILDRLFKQNKHSEAAAPAMAGRPVVRMQSPYGYVDRSVAVSSDRIAANRSIPIVLESLSGLSSLCFSGFDHVLKPIDSSDDKQGPNIEKALAQIRLQEKRIGRVGKARAQGTINLVRAAALDGWSFRQALAEYSTMQEGNWLNFAEIQHLPAQSFGSTPTLSGTDYLPDKILPGIVYDGKQDSTRFFQNAGTIGGGQAKEIDPENIIYIEDVTVPDDLSFLKVLNPVMEQWKEVRKYGMLAEKRVAVPNETERIDANDLVKMIMAKIPVKVQDLIDHCDDLAENQGYANKKVALPGTRIEYPSISMPLDPWAADQYLKDEICDFFFKRNVIKRVEQAISSSDNAAKALLDIHIASEREIWGKPYEGLWNQWLEWNGFELVDEFDWWSWTPEDQKAEHQKNLENFRSHSITLNEYRALEGLPSLSNEEIQKLADEVALIWGKSPQGANALNTSNITV